jgi:predicted amidophosphoribosyltransferase
VARALDGAKVCHDVLLRVKDSPAQSTLPRGERLASVRGAYAQEPSRAAGVQNKRVVLLDDVMTTGATLFEAARVLRRAGAQHITALVVARTE